MFNEVTKVLQTPGSVALIPTDTVYGLAARACDEKAVERLYALKDREQKPGTIIAATIDQLVELGIKRRYLTAVEQFWPAAVSVIIPAAQPELAYLHQGKQSLAIRIPAEPALTELLKKTGPLLTSSANKAGQPTARTCQAAKAIFGAAVDCYVDGGDLSGHQPSTIIKIVDDAIEIIREGAVKIEPNE